MKNRHRPHCRTRSNPSCTPCIGGAKLASREPLNKSDLFGLKLPKPLFLQAVSFDKLRANGVNQGFSRPLDVKKQTGFTLVELIVVMIVVGILAVVALPRMSLMTGFDEIAYRDKVKSALEYARRGAIAHRRVVCVTASSGIVSMVVETNQPEASGSGACASSNPLNLPASDNQCGGGAANRVCPPSGVTLPDTQIGFDGLGRPLSAAGAVLTARTTWTITNNKTGGTTDLKIEAESGYVY